MTEMWTVEQVEEQERRERDLTAQVEGLRMREREISAAAAAEPVLGERDRSGSAAWLVRPWTGSARGRATRRA
jgi:hypothetical protein